MNPYYTPKTDRRRGQIYRLIFTLARHMKSFTIWNLTPALTKRQARDNCHNLVRLNRLKIIRPGTPGQHGKSTIYTLP